jgi:hypothetical protein
VGPVLKRPPAGSTDAVVKKPKISPSQPLRASTPGMEAAIFQPTGAAP